MVQVEERIVVVQEEEEEVVVVVVVVGIDGDDDVFRVIVMEVAHVVVDERIRFDVHEVVEVPLPIVVIHFLLA